MQSSRYPLRGVRILGLALWMSFLACFSGRAQTPDTWTRAAYPPRFEQLTRRQGLSRNSIFALLQDRRGFIWIATDDGLNRYDGRNFRILRHDPQDVRSLSSSWVTALLEDGLGFLWAGTDHSGLNRLDPKTGEILRLLPSSGINALAQDRRGNLWVGTSGQGLHLLPAGARPGLDPWVHFPGGPGQPLPDATIRSLLVDRHGRLWVGCEEGRLMVGTRLPQGWVFASATFRVPPPLWGAVRALMEGDEGFLWIGTTRGLHRYDPNTGRWRSLPMASQPPIVTQVLRDPQGVLWVGSEGHGLDKVRVGKGFEGDLQVRHVHRQPHDSASLGSNDVQCLMEDRTGVLWVGTYADGVSTLVFNPRRQDRETPALRLYVPGDPALKDRGTCVVSAFLEDRQGNLWIGTDGQGLDRVRPPASTLEELHFEHVTAGRGVGALQENVITALAEDRHGRLWAGTYTQGLAEIRLSSGKPTFHHHRSRPGDPTSLPSSFVVSLLPDSNGGLWVGTVDGGLCRFSPESGKAHRVVLRRDEQGSPLPESIYALAEDLYDTLWIGSNDGLFRLHIPSQRVEVYGTGDGNGLTHSYIRSLAVDASGVLWVGTHEGGLNRAVLAPFGQRARFQAYGAAQGLPGGAILGMVPTEGALWVSGPQGLGRFDPATGRGRLVRAHGQPPEGEYSRNAFLRTRGGDLLFGGRGGFSLFRPEEWAEDPHPPQVAFTELEIAHRPIGVSQRLGNRPILTQTIEETTALTLSHREQAITLTFAALHFSHAANNTFQVMLEGLDGGWHDLGTRNEVSYTTLPPGTYVLRVRAANGDGVWNSEGIRLALTITPPFWKAPWFIALGLLTALALAMGYTRLRIRTLARRERQLQQLVDERTAQLQVAMTELEQLATTDAMTGIANYRSFQQELRRCWAQATREQKSLAVVMVDVDHFKRFNDAAGHPAGDEVLRRVAGALQGCLRRAGDFAARYGGEEFVVLLPGTDPVGAELMMERLRQAIEAMALPHLDSPTAPVITASLGGAAMVPTRGLDLEDLLLRADQALYRAKAKGRNRACLDQS